MQLDGRTSHTTDKCFGDEYAGSNGANFSVEKINDESLTV